MKIAIIGSGIIGLSTAKCLLSNGHSVNIFTKDKLADTTSNKAAAIWLPYLAKPFEDVNRWSRLSYFEYLGISQNPLSGISIVDLTVLVKDEDVWWKDALPKDKLSLLDPEDLPANFKKAYTIKSPLIETQIYLEFLAGEVTDLGGTIQFREIQSIERLQADYDLVVNCTGLGAKELAKDESLYPIKGQLLKLETHKNIKPVIADFAFDDAEQELAYIIPRQDYLILGGTAIKGDDNLTPNSSLAKGILERCNKITNTPLHESVIKLIDVGLRPGRPSVRVERIGNVVHNYGHGGSGYTVCWGCAGDVLGLVE